MKHIAKTTITLGIAILSNSTMLRAGDDINAVRDALKNAGGQVEATEENFTKFRQLLKAQREKTRVIKPEHLSGMRLVIGCEASSEAAMKTYLDGIKASGAPVLRTWQSSRYNLLDCSGRTPEELLKAVPDHEGALVFKDGRVVKALSSSDGQRTPESNTVLIRWKNDDIFIVKGVAPLDHETFSFENGFVGSFQMPLANTENGDGYMSIEPLPDKKTMLETFLLSEGGFEFLEPRKDTSPVDIKGTKVLVAFDPFQAKEGAQEEFLRGLKESKVKILRSYRYGFYQVIDCGEQVPEEVVKSIPFQAGAIVFRDGDFVKAIASHDGRHTPADYAAKRWGSSGHEVKLMMSDREKLSKTDGVIAKFHQWKPKSPQDMVGGNPSWMELRPGKGKTLLDVFLIAEAQFDYPGQN